METLAARTLIRNEVQFIARDSYRTETDTAISPNYGLLLAPEDAIHMGALWEQKSKAKIGLMGTIMVALLKGG